MPESHSSRTIEQSRCPKCEIRMMVVGVEPSFAGPNLRTLEMSKVRTGLQGAGRGTNEAENKAAGSKAN